MRPYMKNVSLKEAVDSKGTETLCWDCANALHGGCSWTDPTQQEPVKDWKAIETDMGYRVISCPQFVRNTYGCCRYRTAEDYIEALEDAVRSKTQQVQNFKKTLWWKKINNLQRKVKETQALNGELREEIKRLREKLMEVEKR